MTRAHWKVPRYARHSDPLYTAKPYDKWHAWQDIIARCNALEKPYSFMVGNVRVYLGYGQCFITTRNLARAWGWNKNPTSMFLDWLKTDARITTKNLPRRTGTIVTVTNFAKWQAAVDNCGQLTENKVIVDKLRQIDGNRRDTYLPTGPRVTPTGGTPPGHLERQNPGHLSADRATTSPNRRDTSRSANRDTIKKYRTTTTTAAREADSEQLTATVKAARIFEVYRIASGRLTTPPTKRETRAIKQAVAANDGKWEAIRDVVRDSTARAVARGDTVRSVTYGLGAWKNMQAKKQKAADGMPIPALNGLVSSVAGSVASPAQGVARKAWAGADPSGRPGDGVTKAERAAVKRVRRNAGLEE